MDYYVCAVPSLQKNKLFEGGRVKKPFCLKTLSALAVFVALSISFGVSAAPAAEKATPRPTPDLCAEQLDLTRQQGALYLMCFTGSSTGANTSALSLLRLLGDNQIIGATSSGVACQLQRIPTLSSLTLEQLGTLEEQTLHAYATKLQSAQKGVCSGIGSVSKCTTNILLSFLTMNPTSCLDLANGF
jgi:hypothetical protein